MQEVVYRSNITKILWDNISMVEPYPDTVASVVKLVGGTAFFPGGTGLLNDVSSSNIPTILVLGQDFSTEIEYNRILKSGGNMSSPTWVNIVNLFDQACIDLCDCFFTNSFMGLRKTDSMTGRFPGYRDKQFVDRSLEFLEFQIQLVRPRIIITLGKYAADMLYHISVNDLHAWKSYQALRLPDIGYVQRAKFGNIACKCIALEHPSMRRTNVKRRKYKGYTGNDAELTLLKDATSQD